MNNSVSTTAINKEVNKIRKSVKGFNKLSKFVKELGNKPVHSFSFVKVRNKCTDITINDFCNNHGETHYKMKVGLKQNGFFPTLEQLTSDSSLYNGEQVITQLINELEVYKIARGVLRQFERFTIDSFFQNEFFDINCLPYKTKVDNKSLFKKDETIINNRIQKCIEKFGANPDIKISLGWRKDIVIIKLPTEITKDSFMNDFELCLTATHNQIKFPSDLFDVYLKRRDAYFSNINREKEVAKIEKEISRLNYLKSDLNTEIHKDKELLRSRIC